MMRSVLSGAGRWDTVTPSAASDSLGLGRTELEPDLERHGNAAFDVAGAVGELDAVELVVHPGTRFDDLTEPTVLVEGDDGAVSRSSG